MNGKIKEKKCVICGKVFNIKTGSFCNTKTKNLRQRKSKTCSKECSKEYRKNSHKLYYYKAKLKKKLELKKELEKW